MLLFALDFNLLPDVNNIIIISALALMLLAPDQKSVSSNPTKSQDEDMVFKENKTSQLREIFVSCNCKLIRISMKITKQDGK